MHRFTATKCLTVLGYKIQSQDDGSVKFELTFADAADQPILFSLSAVQSSGLGQGLVHAATAASQSMVPMPPTLPLKRH